MENHLVSIIMPAYNAEEHIKQSIESILLQSYNNWELLITDDRSNDNTQKIVQEYVNKEHRIKLFINDKNGGAGVARNNSIKKARGRFVAFLDADDIWEANKLESHIFTMLDKGYAFTYSAYLGFTEKKVYKNFNPPEQVNYYDILGGNSIGCLTAVYDSVILGYRLMPNIRKRQDMALWLDILKDIEYAYKVDGVLARYRMDSGMTQNKLTVLKYQWKLYTDILGLSKLESCWHFTRYVVNALLKHY